MNACRRDVHFTRESGHSVVLIGCPLSAKSGHSPAFPSIRQHDEIRIFSCLIANAVVGYNE
jgi:hypothetical protein